MPESRPRLKVTLTIIDERGTPVGSVSGSDSIDLYEPSQILRIAEGLLYYTGKSDRFESIRERSIARATDANTPKDA